jgi:hypothetical protein
MGETCNTHGEMEIRTQFFVGNQGKRSLGRPKSRRKDNTKINHGEVECEV